MDEKSEESLQYKGNDPGATRFGNFINYYQFNPPLNRIKSLPRDQWPNIKKRSLVGLDLGCNAGDLTIQLYKFLKEIYPGIDINLIGIDIDPTLIQRAIESNEFPNNISFVNLDFMNRKSQETTLKYEKFDFVFCFSITMWIHLNNGDNGLVNFIKDICEIAEFILIEPQPWKCYKTAVRRMKRSCNEEFPLFSQLKIRNNVDSYIPELIIEEGFQQIFETLNSEWGRKIILFQKKR